MTSLASLARSPCAPCGKDTLHAGMRCMDCGDVLPNKADKPRNVYREFVVPPKLFGPGRRVRAQRRGGA